MTSEHFKRIYTRETVVTDIVYKVTVYSFNKSSNEFVRSARWSQTRVHRTPAVAHRVRPLK